MNLKQLQETRGAKAKEARTLIDAANTAKRALTEPELTTLNALHAEVENLDKQIGVQTRQFEVERGNAADAGGQVVDQRLGLSSKEVRNYSLLKVIRCLIDKKPLDGIEGEASKAEAARAGRDSRGAFVPFEVLASGAERRANQSVGTAADGGYLVGTEIDFGNMVALLRNQSHVLSLGARVLPGLVGDVSIPRQTGGATAYWLTETGQITTSKATFGQIALKPKRLGAAVPYTNQFLSQSGMGVEGFVRDDILAAFGTELDRVAINGAGASEPLGILNLASGDRATSVTFGAAPTWAKVVSFETNVETANALGLPGARYAYLTTPGVRGAWKTTPKVASTSTFLWEGGDLVNGYAARSTNQVPSNKVVYGDFSQVIYGEWLGNEILVDPYTLADTGQVRVIIQKLTDMVIRQGKAFAVSADAGNQ